MELYKLKVYHHREINANKNLLKLVIYIVVIEAGVTFWLR